MSILQELLRVNSLEGTPVALYPEHILTKTSISGAAQSVEFWSRGEQILMENQPQTRPWRELQTDSSNSS